jgi:hypothetical protein
LTLLIEDVRRINSSGDALSQSSLVGLLSLVNSSLKENFEINPEVFKTLQERKKRTYKQTEAVIRLLVVNHNVNQYKNDYIKF